MFALEECGIEVARIAIGAARREIGHQTRRFE
jgi:hypothetical protein